MRCLHCDKKLSLLKLAKGDSFCSPEHFDAYQLQLSKNAYERLLSGLDEQGPETPPVVNPVEVPREELEADSGLARFSAFWAPEKPAAPAKGLEAPPYAPFLVEPLPSFPPNPTVPLAGEADANEPLEAAKGLAFPVHDVEATVCILHLYLRLGLSETPPRDWARGPYTILTPEDFTGETTRPALRVQPAAEQFELPEVIEGAQVWEVLPFEPSPPVAAAPSIRPLLREPARAERRVPFLIAPSFLEREEERIPFDAQASSAARESMLAPVLDRAQLTGPLGPGQIPPSTDFSAISMLPWDGEGQRTPSGFALPAVAALLLPEEYSMEFRVWEVANGPAGIARGPLETSRVPAGAIDFAPPAPAPLHPGAALTPGIDRGQILADAGTVDSLRRDVLETRPRGRELSFVTAPAGALKFGLEPVLAAFPGQEVFSAHTWQNRATHFSFPTATADSFEPAKFHLEPFRYAADCIRPDFIRHDAACGPAPSIAGLPYRRIARQGTDFAPPPSMDPTPAASLAAIRFLPPGVVLTESALIASALLPAAFERAFTAAPSAVFGPPDSTAAASTCLPAAKDSPAGKSEIGLCALAAAWNPCLPAIKNGVPAKFLPVRRSPILPSARKWPRLGAPPQ